MSETFCSECGHHHVAALGGIRVGCPCGWRLPISAGDRATWLCWSCMGRAIEGPRPDCRQPDAHEQGAADEQ